MDEKITREWLEGEVTISREELGEIIAKETATVMRAAAVLGDKRLCALIYRLLTEFGASVAAEIFKKLENDKEEDAY